MQCKLLERSILLEGKTTRLPHLVMHSAEGQQADKQVVPTHQLYRLQQR